MAGSDTTIYVAGNPSLYPLEYYDEATDDFQGTIPSMLREFAQENEYDLRYYEPGTEDRHEQLAENRQVDLISGCAQDEEYAHTEAEPLVLFQTETENDLSVYQLFITDIAPEQFRSQLREFISERTQTEWTGAILETAESVRTDDSGALLPAVIGLGVSVCLLLAALLVVIRRFRRSLRRTEEAVLTDERTGVGTQTYLEKIFPGVVNRENRALYYIIYFQCDLGHIERLIGYEQAAEFQCYAASKLRELSEDTDVLSKAFGTDLVVLKQSGSQNIAETWTREALEAIRSFPIAGGSLLRHDVVAGVCPLSAMDCGLHALLFHARQCAFGARRENTDYRVCGTERCEACQEERQFLAEIDRGIRQGEFMLYLQFFVDADKKIVGCEALSRWQHPEKGLLNPDRFIPLLEREGRLERLDLYNLELVCRFLDRLYDKGIQDFFISCNFARSTFALDDFVERCGKLLERHYFSRQQLVFEITESETIDMPQREQMFRNIRDIRSMGVRVIFDDFGAGFSSFGDLEQYPMDGLKLDKYLVDNMWTKQGRILLEALVRTGHEMGLTILAEGVEDERQAVALRQLKCDIFQGFLFSTPLPVAQAEKRILSQAGDL